MRQAANEVSRTFEEAARTMTLTCNLIDTGNAMTSAGKALQEFGEAYADYYGTVIKQETRGMG
jgi:hypothetical protein